jgi:hypothetical protein
MDGDDNAWSEFGCPQPDDDTLQNMAREHEEGIRQDAEKIGMFCLSSRADDILMWSHYASSHRGACLGFRTTGDSLLWDAQRVEYSEHYPLVDYFHMTPEQRVRKMLLTKAEHWSHEQEWRVFRTGPPPGPAYYPAGMLVQVILGCEMRPTDRNEIVAAVSGSAESPAVYQARRQTSSFRLEFLEGTAGVSEEERCV